MALLALLYELKAIFVDNGGKKITKTWDLVAATAATAEADAVIMIADFSAVSALVCTGYRMSHVFYEDGLVLPTIGEAQAEMAALIVGQIINQPFKTANIVIQGPRNGIFIGAPGTTTFDDVDLADAALVTYLAHYAQGGKVTLSDDEVLEPGAAGLRSGKRIHRGSADG